MLNSRMNTCDRPMRAAALLLAASLALPLCSCEDKNAAPPKQAKLTETPTSLPGRSAAAGRNAARSLESASQQAAGMADEVSGQAQVLTVGKVEFRPPASWTKGTPANEMQKALLQANGDPEMPCVFFSGLGGDVQSNVNRWRSQVLDPGTAQPAESKVITRTVGGMKVTMVSMAGTYKNQMSGSTTEMPDQAFRGAIFEAPGGNVFVRLTGPKEKVEAAEKQWEALITGAKRP